MNKPSVLYHASPNRDIEVFEPRAESVRDENEGPVVFATPSKAFASCFLVNTNNSWTAISRFNGIQTIIISDRKRFESIDIGGAIYHLSSDTFIHEIRGGGKDEWTSIVSVKPQSKDVFESGLQAMLDLGVQVYFVDSQTFSKISSADDYGYGILQNLESENQRLKSNVQELA